MTNQQIKNILSNHSIEYVESNGMVLAIDVFIYKGKTKTAPVNVTGWSESQIKTWLGY